MKKGALGVDIGNVIIDHRAIKDSKDESWWNEKHPMIPATEGVFDCLKKLNDEKIFTDIFLVSKLKEEHDKRTLYWLEVNKFFEKTGIKPGNFFFCRERSDKEKICRDNNITHFVDDRLEVLSYMIGAVPNLYLFQPDEKEIEEFKKFLPEVIRVESWAEVVKKII